MKLRYAFLAAMLALGAGASSAATPPVLIEVCSHTTLSILPSPSCIGSFQGGLTGSDDELALLTSTWGDTWVSAGRSDEPEFGPFTGNPGVAFNGTLGFDVPTTGRFVLGLVSSGKYSLYLVNTKRRIGGLSFDSLEGVATTPQGNPYPLDYAVLYMTTAVPEPGSAWMLVMGLAGLSARVLRRRGAV